MKTEELLYLLEFKSQYGRCGPKNDSHFDGNFAEESGKTFTRKPKIRSQKFEFYHAHKKKMMDHVITPMWRCS